MLKKRIFVFGNTNNYPYILCKAFQELGHETLLLLPKADLLHRPASIIGPELEAKQDWIVDVSHLVSEEDAGCNSIKLHQLVNKYASCCDFAILNDYGPSIYEFLDIPHFSFLTGSDLTSLASFDYPSQRCKELDIAFRRSSFGRLYEKNLYDCVVKQREGLRMSRAISYASSGILPQSDKLLEEIGVPDSDRIFLNFYPQTTRQSSWSPSKDSSLRILCGSRITFSTNKSFGTPIDIKGTDILITGFSNYLLQGGQGKLILPNKGPDVELAKELIDSLQIVDSIEWYDQMRLSSFHEFCFEADIVCDQFYTSFPGMVSMHCAVNGIPLMSNFRYDYHPLRYPGLHVESSSDITKALLAVHSNKGVLREISKNLVDFASSSLSPITAAKQILKYFII